MVIFNLLTLVYIISHLKIALNPDLLISGYNEVNERSEAIKEGRELKKLTKETITITRISILTLIWRISGLLTSDWIIFLIYNIYIQVYSLFMKKKRGTPSYRTAIVITSYIAFSFSTILFLKNIFFENMNVSEKIIALF
jgi:hypothetical protein